MSYVIALTSSFRRLLDIVLLAMILTVLGSLVVVRVVPALTGGPVFLVGGGSMTPTVPLGAVVIDVPVAAEDLKVGDIVTVKVGPGQAIFTHRIVRTVTSQGAVWIETKGDANPTPDPTMIPATTVQGRVATWIPLLGYPVQLLSSMSGVAFLLSVGMVTLLGAWILESLEDDQRAWVYRRRLERAGVIPLELIAEGAV